MGNRRVGLTERQSCPRESAKWGRAPGPLPHNPAERNARVCGPPKPAREQASLEGGDDGDHDRDVEGLQGGERAPGEFADIDARPGERRDEVRPPGDETDEEAAPGTRGPAGIREQSGPDPGERGEVVAREREPAAEAGRDREDQPQRQGGATAGGSGGGEVSHGDTVRAGPDGAGPRDLLDGRGWRWDDNHAAGRGTYRMVVGVAGATTTPRGEGPTGWSWVAVGRQPRRGPSSRRLVGRGCRRRTRPAPGCRGR